MQPSGDVIDFDLGQPEGPARSRSGAATSTWRRQRRTGLTRPNPGRCRGLTIEVTGSMSRPAVAGPFEDTERLARWQPLNSHSVNREHLAPK